ncbi:hypothetical protein UT300003_32080 [Clostridium sardiniense]
MTKKTIEKEANVVEVNEEIMVVVDNGKMNMKAICEGDEVLYTNNIVKGKSQGGLLSENTHNVTFYEVDYTVGNSASAKNTEEGKANSEDIITCLTVITKFIEEKKFPIKGMKVVLLYGESMNKYFNKTHKDFLEKQFVGEQKITRDGVEYEFEITELHILPEGIGTLFEDLASKKEIDELYYITDIGGTTMNFLKVRKLLPVEGECFSEKYGVTFLAKKLKNFISQRGVVINLDVLKKNLIAGDSLGNKKLDELKKEFGLEVVAKLIDDTWLAQDVNIKEMISYQPFYITGGGAELFQDELEEYFKVDNKTVTIKPDSVWSNCRGFRNYGKYSLMKK